MILAWCAVYINALSHDRLDNEYMLSEQRFHALTAKSGQYVE